MSKLPKSGNAIVFVPGLGSQFANEPMDFLGKKLTLSLQRASTDKDVRYSYEINEDLSYSPRQDEQMTAPSASIYKKDGNGDSHVMDVFVYPYAKDLTREYYDTNLFHQLAMIIPSVLLNVLTWGKKVFGAKSISGKDKVQVVLATCILVLILGYAVSIGCAVYETLSTQAQQQTSPPKKMDDARVKAPEAAAEHKPADREDKTGDAASHNAESPKVDAPAPVGAATPMTKWPFYVLLVTTIVPFFMKSLNLRAVLHDSAAQFCGAGDYFNLSLKRNLVLGRLSLLIKAVREATPKKENGKIVLVAYSMGTIVALDTLFPHLRLDSPIESIDSLITIGAPADFIRAFWPDYFDKRQPLANRDRELPWTNIHCPQDIFASNFRDYDGHGTEVDKGVSFRGADVPLLMPKNILFPNDATTCTATGAAGPNAEPPGCPGGTSGFAELGIVRLLLLSGFRLHGIYWDKQLNGEYNVFDLIIR